MTSRRNQPDSRILIACGLAALSVLHSAFTTTHAASPPGYLKTTVALEGPAVGLAFDADGVLYALEEPQFNTNQAFLRVIQPNGTISNTFTITGDDPDSFYVGGMTYDPVGDQLLITDNTADGRLYAVTKNGTQTTIATDIPTIAVPAVRHTGEIFVTTALGNNTGAVVQVDRTTGAAIPTVLGLDYGAGLAFDSAGDLFVQEADFNTFRGRISRVPIAESPVGLVIGAAIPLIEDANSSYGIVFDSDDDLFATGKFGLYEIVGTPAAEVLFDTKGTASQIASAIAFAPGTVDFEPFAGRGGGRLAFNADFGFGANDLFVTIITPTVAGDYDNSGDVTAADYAVWKTAYGSNDPHADGNRDGLVNAADYTVWRNNLGASLGAGGIAARPVPESSTVQLASLMFVFVLTWSARKRTTIS